MPMEDDDDDDCFADVGFMFEGSEASTLKHFEWSKGATVVRVALHVVDEDPGAVQSGHYLWPAAPALAQQLLDETAEPPTSIVELGAGCALASLVAMQLFSNYLECIVVTDHDPGTLQRARDNHEATLDELREKQGDIVAGKILAVPVLFESLSWGDEKASKELLTALQSKSSNSQQFTWVLGSDLIYCREVVQPLLLTASLLLDRTASKTKFLLSQSFPYDEETETEIDTMCNQLGFNRRILCDTLNQQGGVRIQAYEWQEQ